LEVNLALPDHVDGGRQISCADHEVVDVLCERVEDETRRRTRSSRLVRELSWDLLLPVGGEFTAHTTLELGGQFGVCLAVLLDEIIPLFDEALSASRNISEELANGITNDKVLLRVEPVLAFHLSDV
jgi:hypothetical protein